ncbi:MAG: hypothetical protein MRJ65_14375 [Candidatus Brocadiaceae bacterium]|nr:hypothetical protein [Candidatus Brocadiaceae bacterium]
MTELISIINEALDLLYKNDGDLIQRRVHERSLVFRFGLYFNDLLKKSPEFSKLDLDFDYNRNMEDAKRTQKHPQGIYPDLILHKRCSNKHNILALEFKTHWNPGNFDDIDKLKELTLPNQQYRFQLGISIVLGQERNLCTFMYLRKGRVVPNAEKFVEEVGL